MKTAPKTKLPREYYTRQSIRLFGLDWIELPPECRCGSFSKAVTKAYNLPSEAVADFVARPRPQGDCLLKTLWDGRWQIFERRIVTETRYSVAGGDTFGHKESCGCGRLFIR